MGKTITGTAIALVFIASFLYVAEVANANPYHHEAYFTEVPPPIGAHAPVIVIRSLQNDSSYPKNVTLVFDVTILETNGDKSISAVSKLYYEASWEQNEIIISEYGFSDNASFSIDLSGVRGGNLTIAIFAVGYGSYVTKEEFDSKTFTMIAYYDTFKMTGYATVSFTKDLVPPRITVQSPQNKTYSFLKRGIGFYSQ